MVVRIGTLAEALGYSGDLIRKFEREGVLPPAPRDRSGQRRYGPEDVERIREILKPKTETSSAV